MTWTIALYTLGLLFRIAGYMGVPVGLAIAIIADDPARSRGAGFVLLSLGAFVAGQLICLAALGLQKARNQFALARMRAEFERTRTQAHKRGG